MRVDRLTFAILPGACRSISSREMEVSGDRLMIQGQHREGKEEEHLEGERGDHDRISSRRSRYPTCHSRYLSLLSTSSDLSLIFKPSRFKVGPCSHDTIILIMTESLNRTFSLFSWSSSSQASAFVFFAYLFNAS